MMQETEGARRGQNKAPVQSPAVRSPGAGGKKSVPDSCPILSTQSYQVVNLSFDLVNNVESWRQLPPPLVSRASPFPHKTFMKPVINWPDKEEGSRFQKSAAPGKCPSLPPSFLYLKSKHKASIPTGYKVLSKEFHQTLRLAELVWSVAHTQKPSPPPPFLKFSTDMGTEGPARQRADRSYNKNSILEK